MTATITRTCGAIHPYYDEPCWRRPHAQGKHVAKYQGKAIQWADPTALANHPSLSARTTDPSSSHSAAARGFGIPKGVKGMSRDILTQVGFQWMTCREIVEAVFGNGPYTYDEAVGLNKVQTLCLKLYREGFLERRDIDGELLAYRRKQ
jgi:hypothetical protein